MNLSFSFLHSFASYGMLRTSHSRIPPFIRNPAVSFVNGSLLMKGRAANHSAFCHASMTQADDYGTGSSLPHTELLKYPVDHVFADFFADDLSECRIGIHEIDR